MMSVKLYSVCVNYFSDMLFVSVKVMFLICGFQEKAGRWIMIHLFGYIYEVFVLHFVLCSSMYDLCKDFSFAELVSPGCVQIHSLLK